MEKGSSTTRPPTRLATAVENRQQRRVRTPFILLIVLDVTSSMQACISGVLLALADMLDHVRRDGLEAILGLILFRDELCDEMPEVYPLGLSVEQAKSVLANTKASGGGDLPESSLPAIARALELIAEKNPSTPRVLLHITDDRPHDPESGHTAKSILDALKKQNVKFFCCTPEIEPYLTFANQTGGTLFPMTSKINAEAFRSVLMAFAEASRVTVRQLLSESDMAEIAAHGRPKDEVQS